jgi:HD-GYP domain-containing protein (c-di-GMP phosphodiesterase class II)
MKIKGLTTWTVVILIFTTLLSITINLTSRSHYQAVDGLDNSIRDFKVLYTESEFPIKVIKNIESQMPTEDSEKLQVLEEAFQRNLDQLIQFSDDALVRIHDMKAHQEDFKILFDPVIDTSPLKESIETLMLSYEGFYDVIQNNLVFASGQVEAVASQYGEVASKIETFELTYNSYRYDLRETLIVINNATTFVTLFLLAILAFIIFLFLYKDLPYIIESFKKLERKDYNRRGIRSSLVWFEEEKEIHHLVEKIFEEEGALTAFKNQVMSTYIMDEIIDKLYERVNKMMSIQRIGIAFVDYSKEKVIAEYGVLNKGQIQLGPGFQVDLHQTSLAQLLTSKDSLINNDLETYYKDHNKSGALKLILSEGLKSNMVVPLLSSDTVYGFLFFSSNQKNYFTDDHMKGVNKLAYEISGFLNRAYLTKVILSKITASFAELVDRKDNETGGHILRMVSYSVIIAKSLSHMGLEDYPVDKQMILEIQRNAATHDIGKVGIPDAILKKPGKLNPEEWEIMKTHAGEGGDIFKNIRKDMSMFDHDFYAVAEDIARHHHERFDGSGYPDGLKGQAIPLVARIVTLADVFDALTSVRVYKKAFSFEKAIEMIHESKGTQFDPVVVEAFDRAIDSIYRVYKSENDFDSN